MTTTYELHNDSRETLVEVLGKLHKLVEVPISLEEVRAMNHEVQPHVRRLNPIPQRTPEEQKLRNEEFKETQRIARAVPGFLRKRKKVTSVKAAIRESANIPQEVKKLLEEKYQCKDPARVRAIRKTLRKLDYKRYFSLFTKEKGELSI